MAVLPKPSDSTADFIVPDAGVYRMEFTKYEGPSLSTFKNDKGEDQYRIKLFFCIRDEESDFDGQAISAYFGYSMHPTMSKLYPIVKALLGHEPDEDEDVDLDELVGKFIMGTLDNKTKEKDGQKRTYANLIAASPIRKKKAAPKVETSPPPKDEGDELFGDEEEDAA